jgi:hypothetical protein
MLRYHRHIRAVVSLAPVCASLHRRQSLESPGRTSTQDMSTLLCAFVKIPGRVESRRGMKSMGRGTRRHPRASGANGPGGGNKSVSSPPTATWKRREESRRTGPWDTPHPIRGLPCADFSVAQPPKAVKSDATALPEALRARNPYLHSTVAVEPWSLASVWPLSFCQLFTALSRFTTDAGIPVESRFCLGPRGRLEKKKQREPGSWSLAPITAGRFPFPTGVAWSISHVASAGVTSPTGFVVILFSDMSGL